MGIPYSEIPAQESKIVKNDLSWKITSEDISWQDDSVFDLPDGVKAVVVNSNEAERRTDLLIRFPEGYVEPEHTHTSAHATIVLDGTMEVHGETLTSGDYFYGHQQPHGPMKYTCDHADYGNLHFASFVGGSPVHNWD